MTLIEVEQYWHAGYLVRILQDEQTGDYAMMLRIGTLDIRTPAKYTNLGSLKEEIEEAIANFGGSNT